MPRNLGLYNDNADIPRKSDINKMKSDIDETIEQMLPVVSTENIVTNTPIVPSDNSLIKCTISATVTISVSSTCCPVYGAYYMFTIASGGSIAIDGNYRRLVDIDGVFGAPLNVGDTIEISILNGSIIVKNTAW